MKTSSIAQRSTLASTGLARSDLNSCENNFIRPLFPELFKIDLKMETPKGFYGRIAPHSAYQLIIELMLLVE